MREEKEGKMKEEIIIPFGQKKWEQMEDFAGKLLELQEGIDFKLSSRGWCYQLEGMGIVDKGEFDLIENVINDARKGGYLPIDFVATQEARNFKGVEIPEMTTPEEYLVRAIRTVTKCGEYYTPDWWSSEEYYIQMLVEKIDLVTLFEPVCQEYHIPIATSKGWSSILQRGRFARRFKEAEQDGKTCVLLYAGDHDPDGLRISDKTRKNLRDLKEVVWSIDGETGYDPENLIVDRFGLNYDFIEKHGFPWINNLKTGSGKNLASPSHKNYHMEYVQSYLKEYGIRKCEANAIITQPHLARRLCQNSIEKYIGKDALSRFRQKREGVKDRVEKFAEEINLREFIDEAEARRSE